MIFAGNLQKANHHYTNTNGQGQISGAGFDVCGGLFRMAWRFAEAKERIMDFHTAKLGILEVLHVCRRWPVRACTFMVRARQLAMMNEQRLIVFQCDGSRVIDLSSSTHLRC